MPVSHAGGIGGGFWKNQPTGAVNNAAFPARLATQQTGCGHFSTSPLRPKSGYQKRGIWQRRTQFFCIIRPGGTRHNAERRYPASANPCRRQRGQHAGQMRIKWGAINHLILQITGPVIAGAVEHKKTASCCICPGKKWLKRIDAKPRVDRQGITWERGVMANPCLCISG